MQQLEDYPREHHAILVFDLRGEFKQVQAIQPDRIQQTESLLELGAAIGIVTFEGEPGKMKAVARLLARSEKSDRLEAYRKLQQDKLDNDQGDL